ncbi:MAG: adenylate kinase [Clostridia bacterium]|nr:adenylate kinase [Clostridia bacterium]
MRLVLLGPPGAGKGTQAKEISKRMSIPHISTGDMFRQAIKEGTELGKQAEAYLKEGRLVPDTITIGLIQERLTMPDTHNGFLLDGFPRTKPQAEALDRWLDGQGANIDYVLNIEVPREQILIRLTGRRICKGCGATYHVQYNPPQNSGICDFCGEKLSQRPDDTETVVSHRLDVYVEQTSLLVKYYREKGILKEIDGSHDIPEVTQAIGMALGSDWR